MSVEFFGVDQRSIRFWSGDLRSPASLCSSSGIEFFFIGVLCGLIHVRLFNAHSEIFVPFAQPECPRLPPDVLQPRICRVLLCTIW